MLSTLGVGLACGVGQFPVAVFAAGFIIAALWVIEWFEPRPVKPFVLEVKTKESAKVQPKVEELLRRRRLKFELRAASPEEFSYAVQLPADPRTDALSSANIALEKDPGTAVNWEPNKTPKS